MQSFIIGIAIGIAAIVGGFAIKDQNIATSSPRVAVSAGEYKKVSVEIKGKKFSALVADTEPLQEKGLGGRSGLQDDEAMLFIFDQPDTVGFWMKDMFFPIDIVWIGENMKIITIAKNVPPKSYPKLYFPVSPAKYVIEVPAGTMDAIGAKEGQNVAIN